MKVKKEQIKVIFEKIIHITKFLYRLIPTVLLIFILISFWGSFSVIFSDYKKYPNQEILTMYQGAPEIAVIDLKGIIGPDNDNGFNFGTLSSGMFIKLLEYLKKQDNIVGIIILVNSPGGTAVDSDIIASKIKSLKLNKKIVSYIENVGASGAYLVASQSHKIIAHPQALVGSIGSKIELPKIKEFADKIGFKVVSIKSGKLKDITSPFKDITAEEENILQKLVDESYEYFVGSVAEGRKLSLAQVRELADGSVFSGNYAKELKLVDEVGFFEDAKKQIEELLGAQTPLTYKRYYFLQSPIEKLLGLLMNKFNALENLFSSRFWRTLYLWE